ncbi:MAG: hypothetical protein D4R44_07030 [Actinobacteria bacterium]|nr:MAG: hypothetical protein D4R44_07030 [Actinomycetota bacterium]
MNFVQTTRLVFPATLPDPYGGHNVSDCVGLYPLPGCGSEPVLSGDRGGSMQYATFGIMITALIVIGVRIARSIIKNDRARDEALGLND